MAPPTSLSALAVPLDIEPMEAKLVEELPDGDWQYEPKWDGFRCLAFKAGGEVDLKAKSGKPLARYFPEMVEALKRVKAPLLRARRRACNRERRRVLFRRSASAHPSGGESHPASRRRNAGDLYPVRSLLDASGKSLIEAPLTSGARRSKSSSPSARQEHALKLSPLHVKTALKPSAGWSQVGSALDGVVAKLRDAPYVPGERAMMKVKQQRTADCVVGGFRYRTGSREVGSLLLGLYDARGRLDHVGFTATIANKDRAALTAKLEALDRAAWLHGKSAREDRAAGAQSAPNEWQPLKPKLVVEVSYDQVDRQSLPPRHQARALPSRQAPQPMHARADRASGETSQAHRRHAEILRRLDPRLTRVARWH